MSKQLRHDFGDLDSPQAWVLRRFHLAATQTVPGPVCQGVEINGG